METTTTRKRKGPPGRLLAVDVSSPSSRSAPPPGYHGQRDDEVPISVQPIPEGGVAPWWHKAKQDAAAGSSTRQLVGGQGGAANSSGPEPPAAGQGPTPRTAFSETFAQTVDASFTSCSQSVICVQVPAQGAASSGGVQGAGEVGTVAYTAYPYACLTGVGQRKDNEDRCLIQASVGGRRDCCAFAVFDGHGGGEAASLAAHNLPRFLDETYKPGPEAQDSLRSCFARLDALIVQESQKSQGQGQGQGTSSGLSFRGPGPGLASYTSVDVSVSSTGSTAVVVPEKRIRMEEPAGLTAAGLTSMSTVAPAPRMGLSSSAGPVGPGWTTTARAVGQGQSAGTGVADTAGGAASAGGVGVGLGRSPLGPAGSGKPPLPPAQPSTLGRPPLSGGTPAVSAGGSTPSAASVAQSTPGPAPKKLNPFSRTAVSERGQPHLAPGAGQSVTAMGLGPGQRRAITPMPTTMGMQGHTPSTAARGLAGGMAGFGRVGGTTTSSLGQGWGTGPSVGSASAAAAGAAGGQDSHGPIVSALPFLSGTTALVAVIDGSEVHIAHVGDSRAAVVYSDGTSEALTDDHRPSLPREHERITSQGGVIADGRLAGLLAVTRSLGDVGLRWAGLTSWPDVTSLSLGHKQQQSQEQAQLDTGAGASSHVCPQDEHMTTAQPSPSRRPIALVLASDGLWDTVTVPRAAEIVMSSYWQAQALRDIGADGQAKSAVASAGSSQPVLYPASAAVAQLPSAQPVLQLLVEGAPAGQGGFMPRLDNSTLVAGSSMAPSVLLICDTAVPSADPSDVGGSQQQQQPRQQQPRPQVDSRVVAERLAAEATLQGSRDNITVLVVDVSHSGVGSSVAMDNSGTASASQAMSGAAIAVGHVKEDQVMPTDGPSAAALPLPSVLHGCAATVAGGSGQLGVATASHRHRHITFDASAAHSPPTERQALSTVPEASGDDATDSHSHADRESHGGAATASASASASATSSARAPPSSTGQPSTSPGRQEDGAKTPLRAFRGLAVSAVDNGEGQS